ncbi:MAG TPA: M20/M25/M40 family metallo-hydrolase [Gemmatimonadales bacterium]|nr:M20/M25/M40 family metallo-hydrolase [Gemmatimonadales bacterium]
MNRLVPSGTAVAVLLLILAGAAGAQTTPSLDYDKLQSETAQRLSEYLRINTSNPPGNELATARWLQQVLEREGIEGQILDTAELGPGRANFYARLKGTGSGKAIALVHHMDVVPASTEWSVEPFGGVTRDGYVWGRGALDMKGHGIVQLMTLIAIKRAGIPLTRDLVYIGNADEETGGLGSQTFIERHPELIRDVEYVLTESGGSRVEGGKVRWYGLNVGEKRVYWHKLTVKGKASHGSRPTRDNPVPRLARILTRLGSWETPLRVTPAVDRYFKAQATTETGERRGWLRDAAAAIRSPRGRAWLLGDPERNALLRNTISPTVLVGSNKTNTIPAEASAELDIRLLPDQDTVAFRRELLRVINDTAVTLTPIGHMAPAFSAPLDTDMSRAIQQTAAQLKPGVPFATTISTGATDRPYYAGAGLICYGVDPFLVELEDARRGVHGTDERVSVENLGFGLRLYTGVIQKMQK